MIKRLKIDWFTTLVGHFANVANASDQPTYIGPMPVCCLGSASFHSTPDFHNTPQTPSSHIYLEFPTTTGSTGPSNPYTDPTPLPLHIKDMAGSPHLYTASHTAPLKKPKFPAGPGPNLYNITAVSINELGPIRFQAGCRKRRLNHLLSVLCIPGFPLRVFCFSLGPY